MFVYGYMKYKNGKEFFYLRLMIGVSYVYNRLNREYILWHFIGVFTFYHSTPFGVSSKNP